jgi:hypothetical protein
VAGTGPTAPIVTASPLGLCSSGTVNLNAVSAGSTIYWYTDSLSSSSVGSSASGVDFSVSLSSTTTYYAASYNGSCYSITRTPITISLGLPSAPSAVTASPATICVGSYSNLNASSASDSIYWFTSASGGSDIGISSSGADFSVSPVSTTTYYAESHNSIGCVSASRTPVTITVNALATTPSIVTATPINICPSSSSILSAVSAGNNIKWYTDSAGGSAIGTVASGVGFRVTPDSTTTYYAEALTDSAISTTFSYTGSMQSFTVPTGITSITIDAYGAQGGGGIGISLTGGRGARMRGTFAVTPGEVFDILVGGQGGTGGSSYDPQGNENGGGGGSFVVKSIGTIPFIVAGGGGGGPSTSYGSGCSRISSEADGQTGTSGVTISCSGSGTGGSGGYGGSSAGSYQGGAGGGFYSNGANGGSHCVTAFGGNSYLGGGAGGTGNRCYGSTNNGGYGGGGGGQLGGPGGGGGYSGGGTSASWSSNSTYGGGGGSYNTGTDQTNAVGARSGNGEVIISYSLGAGCASSVRVPVTVTVGLPAAPVLITASPSTICPLSTSNLTAVSIGNSIDWYTDSVGGSRIGTSLSDSIFRVTPSSTTTYYAEAVVPGGDSTISFNYTGSMQSFTVPAGVTSVTIDAYGAQGGTSTSGGFTGGLGARSQGDIAVTAGQVLDILVGQRGLDGTCGSGGGGGSFVVRSGAPLVIAGGGGGGFYCTALGGVTGGNGLTTTSGGDGIATPGRSASSGGTGGGGGYAYYGGGGGGFLGTGTSSTGGGGGAYPGAGGSPGGGFGGGGAYYASCCGGSGGGGGYSGGSGGPSDGTAGGGGGSYNIGTSQTMTSGVHSGNGIVTITYTGGAGCVSGSRTAIRVTVNPTTSGSISSTICSNNTYLFNGVLRNTSGAYRDTLINAAGCDSFLTLNLTVLPTSTGTINQTICNGASYFFNGINLTASGAYRDTFTNILGCDSVVTLNLTVRPLSTGTFSRTICNGDTYLFNGVDLSASGTYLDTVGNSVGCDSFVTFTLTVRTLSSGTITTTICNGRSYLFNGINLTASGTYLDTFTNVFGCDSFVTLNLTVRTASTGVITQSICNGTFYRFNGVNLTLGGTYLDTFINSLGCDSIVTLNLTIRPTSSALISATICSGTSYLFNGVNLTVGGSYLDTFVNYTGCDSVLTLSLTVRPTSTGTINQSICFGTFYRFNGVNLTLAGTYRDTLMNSVGCDSVVTLFLTVRAASSGTMNQTICFGSTYLFNGVNLNSTGSYRDTIVSTSGCDSFLTLNLTVRPSSSGSFSQTICNGASYLFNGVNLNAAGIYRDTLININGCDSIVTLNLTVRAAVTSTINQTICNGSSYLFNGVNLTSSGSYRDTFVNIFGCDSVVTLNLNVRALSSSTINQAICTGGSYFFNGVNLTTAGTYRDTLVNVFGCDSTVTLNLSIQPFLTSTINDTMCKEDSYFFNGMNLTTAGTYKDTLSSSTGCDSIVTLNLSVRPASSGIINRTIVSGSSYPFNGVNLTQPGTYLDTLTNIYGCDSTVTLKLSVNTDIAVTPQKNWSLSIYPNPALADATISYSLPEGVDMMQIFIYNDQGQLIFNDAIEHPLLEGNYELDLRKYAAASYFVKVVTNSFVETKKLVVNKN